MKQSIQAVKRTHSVININHCEAIVKQPIQAIKHTHYLINVSHYQAITKQSIQAIKHTHSLIHSNHYQVISSSSQTHSLLHQFQSLSSKQFKQSDTFTPSSIAIIIKLSVQAVKHTPSLININHYQATNSSSQTHSQPRKLK